MDIWGNIYRDHYEGRIHPHILERDDGAEHRFESADVYFRAPRSDIEKEYLDELKGDVADLGAGVGSYARYLEDRGLHVTAVDSSEGAIEVCRRRGCRDARTMDLRNAALEPARYSSFIVMGNTLGIHQTPDTLPRLLRTMERAARPHARVFCVMLDPLDTNEARHLQYHERNRVRGRPAGLAVIRLRYRDLVDDWTNLWMPTDEEFQTALSATRWRLADEKSQGPQRFRLLELSAIRD
jgi:SAM-dependent methyltransferase